MDSPAKAFWDNFWDKIQLPVNVDLDFKNDKAIAEIFKKFIPYNNKSYALEIGCAPGKWLSYIYKELGYYVHGVEYLDIAGGKTKQNLALNIKNEEYYDIFIEDFFNFKSSRKYDLVFSLGFIEHFANFYDVIDLHLNLVNDEGYLVLGFPNFTGFNWLIQKRIDRFLDKEFKLLKSHNLKIMRKSVFREYAKKHNLDIVFLNYIGGFEPALFNIHKLGNTRYDKIIRKIYSFLNRYAKRSRNSFTSSYLMCVLKKNREGL